MAEEKQDKPRGSCLGKLISLLTFAGVAGLGAAVFFVAKPQDLSDIKGRGPAAGLHGGKARNLKAVIDNAVQRAYPLTLTEEDINLYLKETLVAKQEGRAAESVKIEGVWVRLEDDLAELVIERSIKGRPCTVSMYFRVVQELDVQGRTVTSVERHGGPLVPALPRLAWLTKGGRFGSLPVPQGYLRLLVLSSYEKLAKVYEHELHMAFEEMSRIRIEEGKLVLDPRAGGGSALPVPGGTF